MRDIGPNVCAFNSSGLQRNDTAKDYFFFKLSVQSGLDPAGQCQNVACSV